MIHLRWKTRQQCQQQQLSLTQRDWLFDTSSLTQRVKQHCHQPFSVKIIQQSWQRPRLDESTQLGLANHHRALVREVYLLCGQQPFIHARSIIPRKTLLMNRACLGKLGTRPLGEILFSSHAVRRGEIHVKKIDQSVWGRRSLFFIQSHPLLVSEMFINSMFIN